MGQLRLINTSLCLESICESNYHKLLYLIPNLHSLKKTAIGHTDNHPALHLDILERNPYTLTIELSHRFKQPFSELFAPAVKIRIYLDAKLAEVIRDNDRPSVNRVYQNPGRTVEIQQYKWQLNYFLQKWLDHCLKTEYQFAEASDCVI
ncbi:DUF1249 domain-containing protein [Methylomonas sp. MgM2]